MGMRSNTRARKPATVGIVDCLLRRLAPQAAGVDAVLHDIARTENKYTARRDGNLFAGLGIAADALALLANAEGAERRELHLLTARQTFRDLVQHELDELLRLVARQPDLADHGLCQVGTC